MFNIIFPVIIFLSFAVIVFILGKHLPEFVEIKNSNETEEGKDAIKKNKFKKIFASFLKGLKNIFLWLADNIIQKTKDFLSLIQSWVSENRKQKKEKTAMIEEKENISQDFFQTEKENSIDEDIESVEAKKTREKKNFFSSLKESLKEKILERKRKKINQVFQDETQEGNDQYSDGIVKIHEKKNQAPRTKKMINEVVEIEKKEKDEIKMDDEIGVDRNILENKLISKIAKNPRDIELYRQLGELYIKMENYNDAEGCYKQIIKMAVRDVDAKRKIERIKLLKRSQK